MPPQVTRRRYLLGAGGIVGAGAFATGVQASDGCEEGDRLAGKLAERRATDDRLLKELTDTRETITSLESQLRALQGGTDAGSPFPSSTHDIALKVGLAARESVAYLSIDYGVATGWFVDDGLLLTNSHNVEGMVDAHGWTYGGDRFEFEVVDRVQDQTPDVALLRTDHDAPALLVGSASSVSSGDPLVQMGHPGGFGNWVVTLGAVRSRSRSAITSTVPGQSGNSGSPVLTLDGKVVGMTFGGSSTGGAGSGGTPQPSPDDVHYHPLAAEEDSLHVPIELAMERLEAWT